MCVFRESERKRVRWKVCAEREKESEMENVCREREGVF